ncbi:MAG: GNAT family N-acetyltransferase [Alkalibacterium sp.]|nr:GNAT family N-acetyltransferase [Alkalibacterium sp.]
MSLSFRPLTANDFELYKTMETGLKDDYMLKVFDRLSVNGNALFGLFEDDTLVAVAGYTLFAGEFAMLGRLRSDKRYRKNGYGTKITEYILNKAKDTSSVKWVGANTERHNKAAQKVLQKISVPHVITLYAAQADDLDVLVTNDDPWERVESNQEKRHWIDKTYLNPSFEKSVFPFEAYYPFPARPSLFTEDKLDQMICFKNQTNTRVVFMWEEEKGDKYLHVVYPWSDFSDQPGLFETMSQEFNKRKANGTSSRIWMDLTEEEAASLPAGHPFDLPSPWMLHGFFTEDTAELDTSLNTARQLIDQIENELSDLTTIVEHNKETLDSLDKRNDELDSSF